MRVCFLVSFLFLFIACDQPGKTTKKPEINPGLLISCEGIGEVKLTDSHAALEKKFGAAALTEHENTETGKYTTIWENDVKRVNVYWQESKAPFEKIRYIEAPDALSPYLTADSVRVGLTLRELVKKNGNMTITFRNFFASKQGGLIKTFNSGEIAKTNPCLGGNLEWVKQTNIYVAEQNEFRSKEVLESYDRILERIEVVLSSIRISPKQ